MCVRERYGVQKGDPVEASGFLVQVWRTPRAVSRSQARALCTPSVTSSSEVPAARGFRGRTWRPAEDLQLHAWTGGKRHRTHRLVAFSVFESSGFRVGRSRQAVNSNL